MLPWVRLSTNPCINPKFILNPFIMTSKQFSHPVSTCECRSVVRCFIIEQFNSSQCPCYSGVHENAGCLCDEHSPLLLELVLVILVIIVMGIHDQNKISQFGTVT